MPGYDQPILLMGATWSMSYGVLVPPWPSMSRQCLVLAGILMAVMHVSVLPMTKFLLAILCIGTPVGLMQVQLLVVLGASSGLMLVY